MREINSHGLTDGPTALVEALVETLGREQEELSKLRSAFEHQLDALSAQQADRQEGALDGASASIGALERLRTMRERQMRLLGRVLHVEQNADLQRLAVALERSPATAPLATSLLTARTAVRTQAQETRRVCEQLDFALQYAVSLGRELLQAMQALDVSPPPQVYTARGNASQASPARSLVNKVG